jgi:hypothetical protein
MLPILSLAQSSVQGKITDSENKPITNVKITIPELNAVLFSNESGLFSLIQGNRNLLLVIAHPDDEAMFFGPLLSSSCNVSILCLSNGNYKGNNKAKYNEMN